MQETVDAFRYIGYIRQRWRLIASSCAIAVVLALAISLALPREFTATAKIVIEPPAGSDPRGSIAVSPIYLESLRTYEYFASSDSLFRKAAEKFGLRSLLGNRAIESLKKRVLKVATVRNTRIMEISATLPEPRVAQALAQFIAESTVTLDRDMLSEGDRELLKGAEQAEADARTRLQEMDRQWTETLSSEPTEDLQASVESAGRLREDLQQQEATAGLEIADDTERAARSTGADAAEIRRQLADAHARLDELHRRIAAADREAARHEKTLASRVARRDDLAAARKAAQDSLAAAEARLRTARAEAGYRGERLTVIDPGVTPERPSSPNVPLNVMAALLMGFVFPVLYLVLEMNYKERQVELRRGELRRSSIAARRHGEAS